MKFKNSAIYYIIILFAVMVSFYQLTEYMDRSQKRDNSVTKVEVQAKDQGSEGETLDTRLPGKGLENSKPDENIEIRKPTVEGNRAEEKKVPVNSAENTNAASQKN
ncbi:hypothetical protein SAMN00017405_1866 [Desulfonispora thiosulfatigenes DSM 11270]|uniref:Uncharacterized protein n=1 Tax=Desulfonispora thiosulfatigenes DSM 11270 TaxID=656914 RepID=A0A1W1V4B6_DESTI|nr:hypothetical protein [Desulfonispora thiosulfatigenes]SMB88239.1 hypothetical protein SAMN00017405_1866 [Desulfonispora thiosulfatigenes DSM 11270]